MKKFPGNDILLNNLLYFLRAPERSEELISLCKALAEGTKDDAIKYDACRILAETHKARGEYDLTKLALEKIPEIYFTKLQFQALLLEGEDMYAPACEQKELAAEMLVDMLLRLACYYKEKGQTDRAARQLSICRGVIEAMADDEAGTGREQTFYGRYGRGVLEQLQAPSGPIPRPSAWTVR